jgi:hypothetical protein
MSKISLTPNAAGTGTFTIAAPGTNTDRTLTLPDNSGTVLTTATTTGIDASALSTGTVATARLGSGTADSTTFLRGDNTWQTIPVSATTENVLEATASASAGAVGTYGYLEPTSSITASPGSTRAGSGLRWFTGGSTTLSGTWRLLGQLASSANGRVWLRIS